MKALFLYFFLMMLITAMPTAAQINVVQESGLYRLGAVIEGNDTVGYVFLNNVDVVGKMPRHIARQKKFQRRAEDKYARLRYKVRKAYPYAVTAAYVLRDVDVTLSEFEDDKAGRKKYIKKIEAELNKRFKGELEEFTITEGVVLVKLINRQTGKNCYSIIRELKGGFSAVIWQSVALLFQNNLRKDYDPEGDDRDIEMLVRELEGSARAPQKQL